MVWRGRHPDVDDHQLRFAITHEPEQLCAIGGLAHHVETRPVEQTGQTFAKQDIVVGDDDLHGIHIDPPGGGHIWCNPNNLPRNSQMEQDLRRIAASRY